jgi:GH25 family lysozyme M1 (1,4-beta-N-acetylmuramidase)
MRTDIIDLSSNNPQIDFVQVAAAGIKAVLHKATEGVGYQDSKCVERCVAARQAGLKIGVYHYLRIRHNRPQDARDQARAYINVWHGVNSDLLPCLDVETAFNEGVTREEAAQAVIEFCDEINILTGHKTIIYTSHGEWVSMGLSPLTSLAINPLWVASYGSSATAPPPWTIFAAWQFSGSGNAPGVVGPCDLSQCDDLSLLLVPSGLSTLSKVVGGILIGITSWLLLTKNK